MSAVLRQEQGVDQPAPQLRYAVVLEWGTRAGLLLLAASFAAYLLEWLPAHIAPHELPRFWSQPVDDFLQQTGSPRGWGWLALLDRADILGIAGIAVLAGCSAVALLALVPLYLAQRDRAFAALSLLEVAVLLGAASGVFA